MTSDAIKVEVITDLADAPGWAEMMREYLHFAAARHREATGEIVDPDEHMKLTTEKIDHYLDQDGRFIVARHPKGGLAGMILLQRLANGKGEVKRLYVAPTARRMGIANKLMARLEAEARAMGCMTLYLDTTTGLPEAIAFYRGLGFVDAVFDPDSVQDPAIIAHLVFMEKPLADEKQQ